MRAVGGTWLWRLWAVVAAVVVVVLGQAQMAQAAPGDPGVPIPPNGLLGGKAQGALSDIDKDFVVKVRLAGLWEMPAGQMAEEKSDNPRIREIGKSIKAQHQVLDKLDRAVAQKLGIEVPDQPNKDQQGWLGEMRNAEGEEFDQIYIDRLRAAHGKIFPAIATVRASTRNDAVRKLAQQANQFVMTHMTLLESSGIVDYKALPTPPPLAPPSTAPVAQVTPSGPSSPVSMPVIVGVLVVALGVGVFLTRQTMKGRRRSQRHRRSGYGY